MPSPMAAVRWFMALLAGGGLVCAVVAVARAEEPADSARWHVGGSVGLAMTDVAGVSGYGSSARTSWPVALWLDRRLHRVASVGLELGWGRRGASGGTDTVPGTTETVVVDYLEMPLVARVNAPTRSVRPYLALGLAPALRLRSRHDLDMRTGDPAADRHTSSNFNDHTRLFDLGTALGVGLELGARPKLRIELRHTQGRLDAFPGYVGGAHQVTTLLVAVGA